MDSLALLAGDAVERDQTFDAASFGEQPAPARLAFISTMPPDHCGLATFASDLMRAVAMAAPGAVCEQIAMRESGTPGGGGPGSGFEIVTGEADSYDRAADTLNRQGLDLLSVQHEYGIYGGPDGEMLLRLLDRLQAPVVTTLHTVLDEPNPNQRRVMDALVQRSSQIVVMTEWSARLMMQVHGVAPEKLAVVPHGIPDMLGGSRQAGKRSLEASGRTVLLTFGLLSPGKGIEQAIGALPAVVSRHPDLLYVVLGATHPNLVRREGEAYRHGLMQLAAAVGVADHVRFLDRFVELPELTSALAGTDIYITPYQNEAQSVSGTLAYSYGLGTAVVSTPYRHAVELLADGRGVLVPFGDPAAMSSEILKLLDDPARLDRMRDQARMAGREMIWPRIGERYRDIFQAVMAGT